MTGIKQTALKAKQAALSLTGLSEHRRRRAVEAMGTFLLGQADAILAANGQDIDAARAAGISEAMLDRLTLTQGRIEQMAEGAHKVAQLPDPLAAGQTVARPNGLLIHTRRVPLGLVGVIYEARPNVTADVAALCLMTGNACLLRGGKEALQSNRALVDAIRQALASEGLPEDAVSLILDTSRDSAGEMMRLYGILDVLIPRGGAGLIQTVVQNASVPVIETGTGNCHIYVHKGAKLEQAVEIVYNAKCSRPSVCNAAETLLVDEAIAGVFLPMVHERLREKQVELRGCSRTRAILGDAVVEATEMDYATEFLDMILAVSVVPSIQEAVAHIRTYTTGHSEAILTEDMEAARLFTESIDAAAVYVNASTRFTDGEEFGLGAEIGISTQKLHARGPMGLAALTTTKSVILGQGQVR